MSRKCSVSQQLPPRVLLACLEYLPAKDIAISQSITNSWRLPSSLTDKLWRTRYQTDWEAETAVDVRIANAGPDTPWKTRYGRRQQTELNWRSGQFRQRAVPVLESPLSCSLYAS